MTLFDAIGIIRNRLAYDLAKYDIWMSLEEKGCGRTTFFWAWQAATYDPKKEYVSLGSNGRANFKCSVQA